MRRPILLPLALGAAATLVLAGCAKDASQSGSSSSEDEYEMGPLDKYMSVMWEGQDWSEERMQEEDRKREDLVAKCMADQGFEYKPSTGTTYYSSDEDTDGPRWGTLEFAEQYGYGVIDYPGREEMEQQGQDYVDPNQDYLNTLSESEQQAFYDTLYGKSPELTEEEWKLIEEGEMEYPQPSWEEQGCYGQAQHEISGETGGSMWEDPEFADLTQAMNDMYTEMQDDPDYIAVNTEWASCMADEGFPELTNKDDAQQAIYDKYSELYSSGPDGEWVEPSKEDLDKFKEEEIKQAVADFKCADKVKFDDKRQEVDFRKQQEFLDQHKTELDAAIAKYGNKSDDKS